MLGDLTWVVMILVFYPERQHSGHIMAFMIYFESTSTNTVLYYNDNPRVLLFTQFSTAKQK